MTEYLENTEYELYTAKYMKTKILEHFGERVLVTELGTKESVVTLRETASSILYEFHKQQKTDNSEDEKLSIINTAAKLIVSDVKLIVGSNDGYPEIGDITSAMDYISRTLQVFLQAMFVGKHVDVNLASIGQAIMQAIRPRAILAPLQLGIGVQMHYHFASRFLIDTLNQHGFSCSYAEVKKYERSAAVVHGTEMPEYREEGCIQYIADNVDHNVVTIDGTGTFHGMGIVATITPQTKPLSKSLPKVHVTAMDIASVGRINIQYFSIPQTTSSLTYQQLGYVGEDDPTSQLDVLWKASLLLHCPRPAWSEMMQMLHHGHYPGQSSVLFLPMIDLDPGNPSCIYSTLKSVSSQARKYNATPILTFDQPLYWKALTIIQSQPVDSDLKCMVLRLWPFYMLMSFLGTIGHLMTGSRLQELLELVYASNTVSHMLTGKAVSRAVRGHLLVDAALNTILLADAYNVPVPTKEMTENTDEEVSHIDPEIDTSEIHITSPDTVVSDLGEATELYDKVISSALPLDEVISADVLRKIQCRLDQIKEMMTTRTATLWMQYMTMIDILRKFIKAERTGKWGLHLQSVRKMLPYFAASGHSLYAKSAYVYLQSMLSLPETHPDTNQKFEEGYHVVRRSDRYWAGLSTDLIIEQVLMRSIKTSGGLTRGKGMTEAQRLVWVLSVPACANINEAMQRITGVTYKTSDQHKEVSSARQTRDVSDTLDLISYLKERDPFVQNAPLINIANGMTAQDGVNVERSKEIGEKIMSSMVGKPVVEFTFRRANQAVTLGSKSIVKVKGESANKASLADDIWKTLKGEQRQPNEDVQYIIDGGALLHRIPWPRSSTYDSVIQLYVNYVTQKYGAAVIVFDACEDGPTTKDATHLRRTGSCAGVTVYFTGEMIIQSKKKEFLYNQTNKQRFIHYLSDKLQRAGCITDHAKHDADLLIVQTAVTSSRDKTNMVIGDDTDLLILLLYHAEMNARDLFLAPEPKQTSKKRRVWCINQTKELLGHAVCENVLFLHAILGCDTTSRLFGLGKGLVLKKIKSDNHFCQQAILFNQTEQAAKQDIIAAGEHVLVSLYGGSEKEGLDTLRYRRFCDKVSKSTSHVKPQTLPPTSAAAKFHSFRVYYQVMEWRGKCMTMNPEDWGWHVVDGRYMPIEMDEPAAPSELLDVICCGCKKDCNSKRCTCRKYGLPCTAVCRECRGTSCTNAQLPYFTDDSDQTDGPLP